MGRAAPNWSRENVVVSLGEVPESGKYVTRDLAVRALSGCIALGRKGTVPPGNR